MARKARMVVVDTYAIIADLTGQIPKKASSILEDIRLGKIKGLIHYLIIYELTYHWKKGRLPFYNTNELREFIKIYFKTEPLDMETAIKAAEIKVKGDKLIQTSKNQTLKHRKLSVADVTTIAMAIKYKIPIITGDKDIKYIAEKLGIKTIWQ